MSDERRLAKDQQGEDRRDARALLDAAMEPRRDQETDDAGLAAVDEALARLDRSGQPDQETLVVLLDAKCVYLNRAGRLDEALTVCDQEIAASNDPESGEILQLALQAHLLRASLLGRLQRNEEALETATAVAEAIESEEDSDGLPGKFRFLVASAAKLRLEQLVALHRFDDAAANWADLLRRYGNDPDPRVRSQVAWAGAVAAVIAADGKNRKLALTWADDVVRCFESSNDPNVRAGVAMAMAIKVLVLSKRGKLLAASRVASELESFLGPEPEPVVARAVATVPGGHRWIGNAGPSERL